MPAKQNSPLRFAIVFVFLFLGFYYFNIAFLVSPALAGSTVHF